jgi:putative membrane protein
VTIPAGPTPTSPTPDTPATLVSGNLADGEWHRLHPSTPLLRGGLAFIAILGIIIANLRERLFELVFGGSGFGGDPVDEIVDRGLIPIALAVIAVALILFIAGFYLSWRMHTFRITHELVEVRSGILFRTHRKARLDRIQGINIVRPLFARLFGAARLEITGAGNDANVQLAYLGSSRADDLRRDILTLASGSRPPAESATTGTPAAVVPGGVIGQRVAEFTAPELDPTLAPPTSVVTMHPARLIGSTVLSTSTLMFVLVVAGGIVAATVFHQFYAIFGAVPFLFGLGSFLVNRIVKSLRYTIAGTPDGVRVGYGLLTTSNETLPPGRIHSISISQPLLWRPFDWWEVKVNRAGKSSAQGAAGQQNTTILPVGTRAEVFKVLELVLPGLVDDATRRIIESGLAKATPDDGFTNSPRRAAVLRWFSWRRNGFALRPDAVVLRRGAIWRELVVVPAARMQSVSLHQGPLDRVLRVAEVDVHTVSGPISARIGALDAADASGFFRDVAATAIAAAAADRTHRWRSGGAAA